MLIQSTAWIGASWVVLAQNFWVSWPIWYLEKVLYAGKKPEGKKKLGFVNIDVADVVENRHLLDTWPLMDSQQGEIEMKLEWMPLQLENI